MPILSLSFDDDSEEPLFVFSDEDLLMAHIDEVDLDWEEVAERSILDERRGLVITQVAVLEELIDEFILYVTDPADPEGCKRRLDRKTIGPRIDELEKALRERDLLDATGAGWTSATNSHTGLSTVRFFTSYQLRNSQRETCRKSGEFTVGALAPHAA